MGLGEGRFQTRRVEWDEDVRRWYVCTHVLVDDKQKNDNPTYLCMVLGFTILGPDRDTLKTKSEDEKGFESDRKWITYLWSS